MGLPARAQVHYVISPSHGQLVVQDCWKCGVVFATPRYFDDAKRVDGGATHCPNGHAGYHTPGPSVEAQLRKELEAAQAQVDRERKNREWAESRAKGANIAAGKAKAAHRRLRQRVAAGVCPCCQRTFKQLAAHMKAKHPEAAK